MATPAQAGVGHEERAGAAGGPAAMILGVRVHTCGAREAAERIGAMLRSDARHTVIPVNPEMIMAARRNAKFRETLNAADLALADGTGVLIAARLGGAAVDERVPGSDMVEQIAALAAREKLSLFLLGAAPGIAAAAAHRLQERHPGLLIAGTHAGSPAESEEEEIRGRITAARADILLIAYGAPHQELWLGRNLPSLRVRLAMPVGGTFDILAGTKARAPRWMRRAGLEWLFRLAQEPRRWRRMLALPHFALLAFTEQIGRRG